mmetsp:Transcript_15916/g.43651  ORF Transcript_15916/g.43651 Transcript_15916/m.43651 type:complete len:220 (+) Transcript_15916:132-791(+)|eukprot:CAMPEP_0117506598 /NCGR_PEP_ID=MMETSP0784-20121206/25991_1 /TAXON_ID=39447 /ORGANISM="" /LENGTH=219 /DNA_ID=CAMNT_0005302077 /DNA_START=131 /DNA_END=790 /DNA_ORIENTATION=-
MAQSITQMSPEDRLKESKMARIRKERVKEAEKQTMLIARKVKQLDEVKAGIDRRYKDATDNLERMRYDYAQKQSHIDSMMESRSKLDAQLKDKRERADNLKAKLLEAQALMGQVMSDMQRGARDATFDGVQEVNVLRRGLSSMQRTTNRHATVTSTAATINLKPRDVCAKLLTQEMEAMRGYSCAKGTTPTVSQLHRSQSTPGLARSSLEDLCMLDASG